MNIVFEDPELHITGGVVYECEKCSESAKPLKGNFRFTRSGTLVKLSDFLSGAEFTPEILQQLKALTDKVASDPAAIPAFKEEANRIHSSLGDRLEQFCKDHTFSIAFFSMLAGVLATIIAGLTLLKPSEPPVTNNYYYPSPNSLSAKRVDELRRLQNSQPAPRGSNLTPPKKKRPRKK